MNKKASTLEMFFAGRLTRTTALAIFALLLATSAPLCFAQRSAPQTFSSPQEASRALFLAVKHNDDQAMMKVLGGGKALISLEDEVQDKAERQKFVQKYQEMHRLVREPDRTTVLYIGAENWPFPVPLVASHGSWHFDPRTGMREVLYRRIGENEARAIASCHALAAGGEEEQSDSSMRALLKTSADGSPSQKEPVQSSGYYFRVLDSASKKNDDAGVSYIAYPVQYRKTGVMTFIVSDDGVVHEKDLGPDTRNLAARMAKYNPSTWRKAE